MIYSIYNIITGQIIKIIQTNDIESQLEVGQAYIIGPSNDATQYIENGALIDMPIKPDQTYKFDWSTKSWIQDYNLASNAIRSQRATLLIGSDWTQTLNVPFSQEKQQEWAVYRQQLRDITLQSGYPYEVVWPTPPIT